MEQEKSTLLAIAACAYHNDKNGYIPIGRKNSYHTFSDFFIQSHGGTFLRSGVLIRYQFLHSRWRVEEKADSPGSPDGNVPAGSGTTMILE